jgi:hypothetical protein
MGSKKAGLGLLVLGGVLIVAALVIKFVILPGQAQWPDDVDETRKYEGTLHTMLNPDALETMDVANLFLSEVPVTIERHVTTEEVDGGKAIVLEKAVMSGPAGPIQASDTWYAIDRKTMEAIPDFSGNDKIIDREGLVIGFPIGTEKKEYVGWSDDTMATETVTFADKEEERGGLNTYVFKSSPPAKEIKDPAMLAIFPPAIPKDLFLMLAQGIEVPESMQGAFALILPLLPDPVPLKYTYEYDSVYWIEPTTGVLIDYNKHEVRQVALSKALLAELVQDVELPEDTAALFPLLPDPLPLTPVFDLSYQTAAESVEDSVQDAKDAKGILDLFGTTVPLALIVVGLVLALVGLFFVVRR